MNLHALAALSAFTAQRVFVGKRFMVTLILLLLSPALAGTIFVISANALTAHPFFDSLMYYLSLYLVPVLLAMVHGIALTSGEIQDGTAGYLMLAALARWMVALTQIAVTSLVLGLLTAASIAAAYGISSLSGVAVSARGASVILPNALTAWIGVNAYLSFFVLCGYAFRRGVAVSVAAVLVWEFLVAMLPIKLSAYTVITNLRVVWMYLTQSAQGLRKFQGHFVIDLPTYGQAAMFLSFVTALFFTLALAAAMRRSLEGREAT